MHKEILHAISDMGYRVVILAPLDENLIAFQRIGNVKLSHLKSLDPVSKNPLGDIQLYIELRKHFRNYSPELVFTFTVKPNIYGALAANAENIPCIPTITGLGYLFLVGGWNKKLLLYLYKLALRKAKKVFFLNAEDTALFQRLSIGKKDRYQIVPGAGVDTGHFKAKPKAEGVFTFLFIGRLLGHKGVREYVKAAELLKTEGVFARFAVVGPLDSYNPSLIKAKELASWLSKEIVDYYGEVKDPRPYYQAADVIVLPSYREGLSTVIVEALSMQRPVITTDVAGCIDAVDKNCAWIIPPRDSNSLAEAMKICINTPKKEREQMGARGRQRVKKLFSKSKAASPYIQVLDSKDRNDENIQLNEFADSVQTENSTSP
ncbi:MAG: glycosyltransferase [Bacteroidetes bacterium]|jgi:glycosyltransferase involved in cell wall biosynthesis|nr:glycosyltransferase [Bacteroidota bacterium]